MASSSQRTTPDLEISLRPVTPGMYCLDLRLTAGGVESQWHSLQAPLSLARLQALEVDPAAYGSELSAELFADEQTRLGFAKAQATAEALHCPLRLRLLIEAGAAELHALHWETLRHPQDKTALGGNENFLFSRYIGAGSLRPFEPPPKKNLRALALIANPTNLATYALDPLDVAGELQRAREALGTMALAELPDHTGQRATLNNLIGALRHAPPDILYLAAHGKLFKGEPWLFLEDEAGQAARVPGAEVVTRLQELPERPLLIVLVACECAAALGPRLAEAGFPAVLAVLGDIGMKTVKEWLPHFFGELLRDGQVDRALTAARGMVSDACPDAWQVALFTRLKAGQLFVPDRPGASTRPTPGLSPYKGLHCFEETDADNFFGREALTEKLVRCLREGPFLAVVGASGSGKSSLVRAGLLPALKRGALWPEAAGWARYLVTPGVHPLQALALSLTRPLASVAATTDLLTMLAADARALHLYVCQTTPEGALLVVDQFEELFTTCTDTAERQAFIDTLMYAADPANGSPLRVLLVLRADFYAACAPYATLRRRLAQQEYIGPMTTAELRRAMEEPARGGHWTFEPGLVEIVLNDVGNEPGALPLLSHALLETWKRRQGRMLTAQGYMESGGVRGAITQTAEAVYTALPPDQQALARHIFVRLTAVGDGAQDTRRTATLAELSARPEDAPAVHSLLEQLADKRLIATADETVEVAHEALIRGWPRLQEWLDEDREGVHLHHHLAETALDWARHGRPADDLYRGGRLVQAAEWTDAHAGEVNVLEREFVRASREAAEKVQAERETQHQRQLDDAHRLAEAAQALAQEAEVRLQVEKRLSRLNRRLSLLALGTGLLGLLMGLILINPQAQWRRLQALGTQPKLIEKGDALVGESGGAPGDYLPLQHIALSSFRLEPYEVTNARYQYCVQAGACMPPVAFDTDYAKPDKGQYPVRGVTALQAAQFCAWLGRRLPSEFEWERAARSTDGQLWPWGANPLSPDRATFAPDPSNPPASPRPVGATPAGVSPAGLYDLVGNVSEWTRSDYDLPTSEWDDIIAPPPARLVVRGGSYMDGSPSTMLRVAVVPEAAYEFIGFRCAASP